MFYLIAFIWFLKPSIKQKLKLHKKKFLSAPFPILRGSFPYFTSGPFIIKNPNLENGVTLIIKVQFGDNITFFYLSLLFLLLIHVKIFSIIQLSSINTI